MVPPDVAVVDDPSRHRFELTIDGATAFLDYRRMSNSYTVLHTEVPLALRGRHLGRVLIETAVDALRAAGLRRTVIWRFAGKSLRTHPRSS